MLTIGFSRWLVTSDWRRRSIAVPGRGIVCELADGSGRVELPPEQWNSLLASFDREARPVQVMANWLFGGLIPAIFVYAMTIGQILPGTGLIILASLFLGPSAIYLWYAHKIRRISERIERELGRRPRVSAPARLPQQLPRPLEIACVLLLGPHLIFEVYGSITPDAYRNTPLSGTQLDWTGLVAFLVLATVFFLRWRMAWAQAPREVANPRGGRRADVIARAREIDA